MSDWHCHPLALDLGAHAGAWDALNQRSFGGHPLLDSRFWNGLLRHFAHPNVELWICTDGDAVLAMCLLEHKGLHLWRSFLPAQAQMGPVMIAEDVLVQRLLQCLPPMALQLDLLAVDPEVCALNPTPQMLAEVKLHALTMSVSQVGTFDAYWAGRSSGLRQNMRRYAKRAESLSMQFEFRCIERADEIAAAVRRYAELEVDGWKGGVGTAVAPDSTQEHFYTSLLGALALTNQAAVHELWSGGRLTASRLLVRCAGTVVMLKTTYDEYLAHLAPGWQLLMSSLQAEFSGQQAKRVEFYTNATQGQLPWSTGTRWIRHISYSRPSALGAAHRSLRAMRLAVTGPPLVSAISTRFSVSRHALDGPWPTDVHRLFARAGDVSLATSAAWYMNLHRTVFGDHPEAVLWVMRNQTEAVAALPVVVDRGRLGSRLSILGNFYTAYFAPTLAPNLSVEETAVLFQHLRAYYLSLGRLSFEPLDPQSDDFHRLQWALKLAGLVTFRYFRFGNWYSPALTSYAEYLKSRSANLRSRIKRNSQRLADEGGTIEICTAPADLGRGLAAYWQVYNASWKVAEPVPGFIDGLVHGCAANGTLRLGLVWLADQPIAAQIWLVAHGKAEIFKVAYDEARKPLSPGTVLTAALLEHVMDVDGVNEVDFLKGDDPYKQAWMSQRRERWGLVAFDPLQPAGLAGLIKEGAARLAKTIRQRFRSWLQ